MRKLKRDDYEVIIGYLVMMNLHMVLNALASFGIGFSGAVYLIALIVMMGIIGYGLFSIYGIRQKKVLRIAILINLLHIIGISVYDALVASSGQLEITMHLDILKQLSDNIPAFISIIVFVESALTGLLETFATWAIIRYLENGKVYEHYQ